MFTIIILLSAVFLFVAHRLITKVHYDNLRMTWACGEANRVQGNAFGLKSFWKLMQASKRSQLSAHFLHLHREFGNTFSMQVLGNDPVFTIEPQNVKAILATQFSDFGMGIRHAQMFPLIGDGIFSLDGEGWAHSRALLRPQFSRDQICDSSRFEVHTRNLINALPPGCRPFDIQDLFLQMGLDSATDLLFGESVGCLLAHGEQSRINPDLPYTKKEFTQAFEYTQEILVRRVHAQKYYWLVRPRRFYEAIKVVHGFIDHYVERAVRTASEGPDPETRYIFLNSLAGATCDKTVLRHQLLHALLAGRDTTSSLLSSVFYLLARHSRVWKKLRKEIIDSFGDFRLHKRDITVESLKHLKYLGYVINETLRLLPPVPVNGRVAIKDTTLPTGGGRDGKSPLLVKKGQSVRYACFAMHRKEDLWGLDAAEFRPERWDSMKHTDWEYLPFSGGPRICLGQQLALAEARYVIATLLQRFDTLEDASAEPDEGIFPGEAAALVWTHKRGVCVRLYSSEVDIE